MRAVPSVSGFSDVIGQLATSRVEALLDGEAAKTFMLREAVVARIKGVNAGLMPACDGPAIFRRTGCCRISVSAICARWSLAIAPTLIAGHFSADHENAETAHRTYRRLAAAFGKANWPSAACLRSARRWRLPETMSAPPGVASCRRC